MDLIGGLAQTIIGGVVVGVIVLLIKESYFKRKKAPKNFPTQTEAIIKPNHLLRAGPSEQPFLNQVTKNSKKKKKRKHKKMSQQLISDPQPAPIVHDLQPKYLSSPRWAHPQNTSNPLPPPKWQHPQNRNFQPPATSLTPQSLTKMIAATPLLQQRQVAALYKGIMVSWEGQVGLASPGTGKSINIFMSCGEVGSQVSVSFDASLQYNPSLNLLKQGDKVMVTGQIEDIQSSYVRLRQASVIKLS
jgi:hypothetical protein